MPFSIEEDSMTIRGRRGESVSLKFDFNQDISDYTVHFYVTNNAQMPSVVLEKTYENTEQQVVTVSLTADDTKQLKSQARTPNTYFWWLKITKGTEFAKILIPQDVDNPPTLYIYPGIGDN